METAIVYNPAVSAGLLLDFLSRLHAARDTGKTPIGICLTQESIRQLLGVKKFNPDYLALTGFQITKESNPRFFLFGLRCFIGDHNSVIYKFP